MDNSLLASIQKGKKLKKAVTKDRSAPLVGGGVVENGKSDGGQGGRGAQPSGEPSGGPRLAGPLFAGGMPKLRPVGGSAAGAEPKMQSRPQGQPTPPQISRPQANTRAAAPPPPPPPTPYANSLKKPSIPSAPASNPAPVVRRPAPPSTNGGSIERGMASMGINNPPPFLPSQLRKTGADMTRKQAAPSPPAPIVQNPKVNRLAPRPPPSPSTAEYGVPASSGLASANGRWKFPVKDSELPPPPPFDGVKKIYPSGRTNGTVVQPDPSRAPEARPSTMNRPPLQQAVPATKKPSGAMKANPIAMIEQKIQALSAELKAAIANEHFEQCIELRGRIKKLRELMENVEQGFEVSPAEIKYI